MKGFEVEKGEYVVVTPEELEAARPEATRTRSAARTRSRTCRVTSRVDRKQLDMAVQLIDSLATRWDPERYRDTYRERVLELIERKAEARDVVTEEPKTEPRVRDLMEALRASVEAVKQAREPARRSGGKKPAGRSRAKLPAEDLEKLSREELYERAQSLGIPGRSSMSKKELVRALKRAS